jgi:hypothetical protein
MKGGKSHNWMIASLGLRREKERCLFMFRYEVLVLKKRINELDQNSNGLRFEFL